MTLQGKFLIPQVPQEVPPTALPLRKTRHLLALGPHRWDGSWNEVNTNMKCMKCMNCEMRSEGEIWRLPSWWRWNEISRYAWECEMKMKVYEGVWRCMKEVKVSRWVEMSRHVEKFTLSLPFRLHLRSQSLSRLHRSLRTGLGDRIHTSEQENTCGKHAFFLQRGSKQAPKRFGTLLLKKKLYT